MKHFTSLFLICGFVINSWASPLPDSTNQHYDLFHPKPKDLLRPFSTDRPDATESPYTVDAGHFQYETDLFITERKKNGNIRMNKNGFNVANLKLGITHNLDFQFIITTNTVEKIKTTSYVTKKEGVGEITIRLKQNLWGNDKGKTAMALLPFVTIPPIASGEGVSGGLMIPFSLSLGNNWNLSAQIGSEISKNLIGSGYHLSFLTSATTSFSIFNNFDFFMEGLISNDMEENEFEYFINTGLVYGIKENINIDAGTYYGIRKTSSKTYFIGLSFRL